MAGQPVVHLFAVGADWSKATDRVELRVAVELEAVAGIPVRPRPGDGVHRSARSHPVVSSQPARRDAEFLKGVWERQREPCSVLRVVVQRAIQEVRHAELHPAANGNVHAALKTAVVRPPHFNGATGEDDQVGHLTSLERQLDDALLLNHFADAGALCVDERRSGLDGDRLGQLTEPQRDIDRGRRAHLEDDARLREGSEPGEHCFEPVGPSGRFGRTYPPVSSVTVVE